MEDGPYAPPRAELLQDAPEPALIEPSLRVQVLCLVGLMAYLTAEAWSTNPLRTEGRTLLEKCLSLAGSSGTVLLGAWACGRIFTHRFGKGFTAAAGLALGAFLTFTSSGPEGCQATVFNVLSSWLGWFLGSWIPRPATRSGSGDSRSLALLSWAGWWLHSSLAAVTGSIVAMASSALAVSREGDSSWVESGFIPLLHAGTTFAGTLTGFVLTRASGSRRSLLLLPLSLAAAAYIGHLFMAGFSFPIHQPSFFFPAPVGAILGGLAGVFAWGLRQRRLKPGSTAIIPPDLKGES